MVAAHRYLNRLQSNPSCHQHRRWMFFIPTKKWGVCIAVSDRKLLGNLRGNFPYKSKLEQRSRYMRRKL